MPCVPCGSRLEGRGSGGMRELALGAGLHPGTHLVLLQQARRHLRQAGQQVERVGGEAARVQVEEAEGAQAVATGGHQRGACRRAGRASRAGGDGSSAGWDPAPGDASPAPRSAGQAAPWVASGGALSRLPHTPRTRAHHTTPPAAAHPRRSGRVGPGPHRPGS